MIPLPGVPGIVFAYDARHGVTLEPLEAQAIGQFDYAVDVVAGIKGTLLERRRSGTDPYRAMQVPFNPAAGYNGHSNAYAPAFDFLATQQSALQSVGLDLDFVGADPFASSFVVCGAMRAATPVDARMFSYYGADPNATDDGFGSISIIQRDGTNNAVKTSRYPASASGPIHQVVTPIELDRLYRFAVTTDRATITQYIDNVVSGTAPQYDPDVPANGGAYTGPGRVGIGGQANNFMGHMGLPWDGPILFAMGANVTWSAAELAAVDAWIIEEFNL